MDAGSAENADDPADVEVREGRALQLILSGIIKIWKKKCEEVGHFGLVWHLDLT
jgi:hypothetical protein